MRRRNIQVFSASSDNERRQILNGGQILRIVMLDHDIDTAVYQCNASNPFGYVFANAFVNVRGGSSNKQVSIK